VTATAGIWEEPRVALGHFGMGAIASRNSVGARILPLNANQSWSGTFLKDPGPIVLREASALPSFTGCVCGSPALSQMVFGIALKNFWPRTREPVLTTPILGRIKMNFEDRIKKGKEIQIASLGRFSGMNRSFCIFE
ncbi:hypothetical protein ACFLQ0_06225, partial [Nitrospinota bacterium]